MAQLEPLNLRITGNANGLSAELGKAQREVSGFDANLSAKAGGITSLFTNLSAAAGPVAGAVSAALAAITVAAGATVVAVNQIYDEFDKLADFDDTAKKLAISFKDLRAIDFAIGELAGLDSGTTEDAIQKLLVGLDEARTGSGKTKEALDKLGLDAGQLLQAGPLEALKQIADATQALGDPAQQLGIAFDLFGKNAAQVVVALRGGRDAIEESSRFAARWLALTEGQVEAAAAASDSWNRIAIVFEGLFQTAAVELAPVFLEITASMLSWAGPIEFLKDNIRTIVDASVEMVGNFYDLLEVLTLNVAVMNELAALDFRGAGIAIENAFTFDSGARFRERLDDRRAQFELDGVRAGDAAKGNRLALGDDTAVNGLMAEQEKLSQQQAVEAEKEAVRHRERLKKFDDAQRSLDRLLDATKNQKKPTPVDL